MISKLIMDESVKLNLQHGTRNTEHGTLNAERGTLVLWQQFNGLKIWKFGKKPGKYVNIFLS